MKNRSYRYDINRPTSRHGQKYTKYDMYLSIMMVVTCIKQYLSNLFEAQFMKKSSNTEASWKKALPIKKACNRKISQLDEDTASTQSPLQK